MDSIQSKGGKARAEKLTPARRKEIATTAAQARWSNQGNEVTKLLRIESELWLWVVARAAERKVSPGAWLVRCIRDARKRIESAT